MTKTTKTARKPKQTQSTPEPIDAPEMDAPAPEETRADAEPETVESRNAPEMTDQPEPITNDPETVLSVTKTESVADTALEAEPEQPEPETEIDLEAEPALDPEPEVEAVLTFGQCPRCRYVSGPKAVKLGNPIRHCIRGVMNGVEYSLFEVQRIMCEKCGQIHCVKTYK